MKLSSRRCWSHSSDAFLNLKRFNYFRLFCQPQVYVLLVCLYIIFKKLNKVHNILNTNSFVILNTFLSCLSSLGKFIMIRKIIQVFANLVNVDLKTTRTELSPFPDRYIGRKTNFFKFINKDLRQNPWVQIVEKILATHQFYIQDSLSVPYDTNTRRYIINVSLVPVCLKQKQQYSYFTMSCFSSSYYQWAKCIFSSSHVNYVA